MTAKDLYEYALIELNKLEAPSLLLEDYEYFINKAVQQYINLVYNRYDVNQQSTDDLSVLKVTTILKPEPLTTDIELLKSTYCIDLPEDYLHILNCIIEFTYQSSLQCNQEGKKIYYPARRLTSDMFGPLINNAYLKPTYKRPYYFINKQSLESDTLRLELRFGKNDIVKPTNVYIDYIRQPKLIKLTYQEINDTVDKSQNLEFPDYVCYEIVNLFTNLVMENASDIRLRTHIPINQTIASGIQNVNKHNN